jgi:mRNA deadenylase 3'-5' endonuclease subunit Ccr4
LEWNVRKQKIIEYLKAKNADIIAVQEYDKDFELDGSTKLGDVQNKLAFFFKENIDWNCSLIELEEFDVVSTTKAYMIVKCENEQHTMLFANTHLPSKPNDPSGTIRVECLQELDQKVTAIAEKERERNGQDNVNVTLLGDMNTDLHSEKDIWRKAFAGKCELDGDKPWIDFAGSRLYLGNLHATKPGFRTSVTPQRQEMLDYVWSDVKGIKDQTEELDKGIQFIPNEQFPSDHIAVVVQMGTPP